MHGRSFAGVSPLHVAAYHGRVEVLSHLLRAGGVLPLLPLSPDAFGPSPVPLPLQPEAGGQQQQQHPQTVLRLAKQRLDESRRRCNELLLTRRTLDGYSALSMAVVRRYSACVAVSGWWGGERLLREVSSVRESLSL